MDAQRFIRVNSKVSKWKDILFHKRAQRLVTKKKNIHSKWISKEKATGTDYTFQQRGVPPHLFFVLWMQKNFRHKCIKESIALHIKGSNQCAWREDFFSRRESSGIFQGPTSLKLVWNVTVNSMKHSEIPTCSSGKMHSACIYHDNKWSLCIFKCVWVCVSPELWDIKKAFWFIFKERK